MKVVPGPEAVRDQRNLMGFKHEGETASFQLPQIAEEPGGSSQHPAVWELCASEKQLDVGIHLSKGPEGPGLPKQYWSPLLLRWRARKMVWVSQQYSSSSPVPQQGPARAIKDSRGTQLLRMNDTAKEEEYPWLLCKTCAKGLKEQLWHFLQDGHFARSFTGSASNGMPPNLNRALRGWERTETKKSPPATWRSGRLPWLGEGNDALEAPAFPSVLQRYRCPCLCHAGWPQHGVPRSALPCHAVGVENDHEFSLGPGGARSTSLRWPPLSLWSSTGAAVPTIVGADGSWLWIILSPEEPSPRDGHHLGVWTGFSAGRQQPS